MLATLATYAIEAFFYTAPFSVLPLLSNYGRLDLVDYYKAQEPAEVTNIFDGKTTLTALSDSSLTLRLSEASELRIALTNDSTIETTQTFFAVDTTQVVKQYDRHWKLRQ